VQPPHEASLSLRNTASFSGQIDLVHKPTKSFITHQIIYTLLPVLDTFGTPKRVCSQFPFPRLGFSTSTGSGASRLAAPIRRHNDADWAVDPLIVAAASTTTLPFHAKYNSQAWEMGTGNKPFRCAKGVYCFFLTISAYHREITFSPFLGFLPPLGKHRRAAIVQQTSQPHIRQPQHAQIVSPKVTNIIVTYSTTYVIRY
jgi:hypothetical protein